MCNEYRLQDIIKNLDNTLQPFCAHETENSLVVRSGVSFGGLCLSAIVVAMSFHAQHGCLMALMRLMTSEAFTSRTVVCPYLLLSCIAYIHPLKLLVGLFYY